MAEPILVRLECYEGLLVFDVIERVTASCIVGRTPSAEFWIQPDRYRDLGRKELGLAEREGRLRLAHLRRGRSRASIDGHFFDEAEIEFGSHDLSINAHRFKLTVRRIEGTWTPPRPASAVRVLRERRDIDTALDAETVLALRELLDALEDAAVESPPSEDSRGRLLEAYAKAEARVPEYRRLPPEGWAVEILETSAQFLGQTRERPGGPVPSKRPTRPPGMKLGELDRWIKRGKTPPPDRLRPAVEHELVRVAVPGVVPGPRYVWLLLAAAVLDDAALFRQIVRIDYRRDAEAYRRRRAEGMGEEDLGKRPSPEVSADRLLDLVELALERTRGPLVDLLRGRLKGFRDALD